jgi:endonuclease/exonuclease/phosphatase family metal-dependent hydrolase
MRRRFALPSIPPIILESLEAALVTLFWIQSLRFLVGNLYSRVASAAYASLFQPEAISQLADLPGFVTGGTVQREVALTAYMLALPLVLLVFGRLRVLTIVAVLLTGIGRTLMIANLPISATAGAALALGGGLLYIGLIIRHRPDQFPIMMILALTTDQTLRAVGNTLDPTWAAEFFPIQAGLFAFSGVLAVANHLRVMRALRSTDTRSAKGTLTVWGGFSFGAMIYLQLSLLAMPNAITGRAGTDYTTTVPLLIAVTFLPLIGLIRDFARNAIGLFDSSVRGWVWLLLIDLLLVLGTRFTGVLAGIGFIAAQFTVSMLWWWLIRPQADGERNFTGLWLFLGALTFGLWVIADTFTYEYAYVRGFAPPFDALNTIIVPLLKGFRGLGYAVILLASLVAVLPMLQTQRRIAWRSNMTIGDTVGIGAIGVAAVAVGAIFASPPLIFPATVTTSLRVGTYNVHGGYTEFYAQSLEEIAQTIERSGANVILLQEIEAGRMTSYGVDQPLWLARRLNMDRRFYPTNEGLQGLAVLSNVPIVFDDGVILTGIGQQTGLQRVQVLPTENGLVTIYNTWLGLLIAGEDIEEQELDQRNQLEQIIRIIGEHHPNRQLGRTVLGGTFNNIPDAPVIRSVGERGFSDPFAGATIERAATLRRVGLNARVDYLWIYPEIAEGVGVIDSTASDHRLAFVSISLGGGS